jgi:hypothetical protein
MSKIKVADFYYGAALSVLFNNSKSGKTLSQIREEYMEQEKFIVE